MKSLYHCLLLLSFCLSFKRMISNDHFAGIVLILAGQCVSAIQMIVEELFLKKKNFHPLQVSSLLDKKIKIVYFYDDFHVIFVFLFSFFVFLFVCFCFCFFSGGGLSLVYSRCITVCYLVFIQTLSWCLVFAVEQWAAFSFSLYMPCKVNTEYPRYSRPMKERKYSWTSPQRPPWGQMKVAFVERFKQESMYGLSAKIVALVER